MIAGLYGTIESRGLDFVVVEVGGISFKVFVPTSVLSSVGALGEKVKLYTYLHVREDAMSLYGFATEDERFTFELLLGVSGVGPKVALSILSAIPSDRFMYAIASENVDLLTQVPGIGKKVAARLILELKGKIDTVKIPAAIPVSNRDHVQVLAALGALGYSSAEAAAAVATLPDSPELPPEEKIRLALAYFASK